MTAEHTSEKLAPIKVPCEGSNLVGHAWFAETIGECVLCQMCGGTFGAVVGHPDQVPLHDRIDIIAMITRGDFDNDIASTGSSHPHRTARASQWRRYLDEATS